MRIPAAVCGVVGLKPGRGLVSLKGVHPLSPALDTLGVLARDVSTAARMLAAISGPDGGDAVREPFDAETALNSDVRGLRLAAIPLDGLGEVDPQVGRIYLEALERLRGAGLRVEIVEPPQALEASFAPNGLLMAGEGFRIWRARIEAHVALKSAGRSTTAGWLTPACSATKTRSSSMPGCRTMRASCHPPARSPRLCSTPSMKPPRRSAA